MKNCKIHIKHKIIIYVGGLLLSCSSFLSCEQMLDVEVPANQIGKKGVFNDVQSANAALAGLYAGLRESSPISGGTMGSLLGTYTDDLESYALTDTDGSYSLYNNQLIDTNSAVYSFWSTAYQNIYAANAIIEGIDSSSLPVQDKNSIRGEALLVRSLLLFYLQQSFGDIPYPVTTDYTVNQSLSRSKEEEVLLHLENDLNECSALLPDEYRSEERIFPNRKVAQLMKAKVNMLQKKWNQAEILLKEVVQSPTYIFQNDINKVFQKTSPHIIWQLKPQNTTDPTKEALLYYFSGAAPSNYAISESLKNVFTAGDLRKQNWMAPVTFNGTTWYRPDKYKNRLTNTTEYSIVLRLEEVYLLLAESLTEQNQLTEALQYINPTRQRAGLSPINMPIGKDALLNEILLEDRKEFFTEMGHRFLDLKRTGKLQDLSVTKPNWKSFHQRWPIPQKELLLNPNLNPQNNGY